MNCIPSAENVAKLNTSYLHLRKAQSLPLTSHNTGPSYTAYASLPLCSTCNTRGSIIIHVMVCQEGAGNGLHGWYTNFEVGG